MTGAVLLDALGTLVELQPPAPRLRALLAAEGFSVSEEREAAAFRAEIAYYLEHHLDGSDRPSSWLGTSGPSAHCPSCAIAVPPRCSMR